MAEGRLAPAENTQQDQYVSAPSSADFLFLSGKTKRLVATEANRYFEPNGDTAPTNEYGVAQPLFTLDCRCGRCNTFTRHHLHSTDNLFRGAGPMSTEFKELQTLSVWTPRCRHSEHHGEYSVNTMLPNLEIMEQCIYEERVIRDITMNGHATLGISKKIDNLNTHPRERIGLIRRREILLGEKPDLIKKLKDVFVTPEELVTGALLIAAPNYARSRLMEGTGYVLTGILPLDKVREANDFAQSVLREIDMTLQTGVDGVELAA